MGVRSGTWSVFLWIFGDRAMRLYRREKVASLVRQVLGKSLIHEIRDPRVSPRTTITRVEITADMLVAKVYILVSGSDAEERLTLAGIRSAEGYLQRKLASVLTMRQCPELKFNIDEQAKGAQRTMALLDENRRLEPEIFEMPMEASNDANGNGPLDDPDDRSGTVDEERVRICSQAQAGLRQISPDGYGGGDSRT